MDISKKIIDFLDYDSLDDLRLTINEALAKLSPRVEVNIILEHDCSKLGNFLMEEDYFMNGLNTLHSECISLLGDFSAGKVAIETSANSSGVADSQVHFSKQVDFDVAKPLVVMMYSKSSDEVNKAKEIATVVAYRGEYKFPKEILKFADSLGIEIVFNNFKDLNRLNKSLSLIKQIKDDLDMIDIPHLLSLFYKIYSNEEIYNHSVQCREYKASTELVELINLSKQASCKDCEVLNISPLVILDRPCKRNNFKMSLFYTSEDF